MGLSSDCRNRPVDELSDGVTWNVHTDAELDADGDSDASGDGDSYLERCNV